jgi:hypothetical protein
VVTKYIESEKLMAITKRGVLCNRVRCASISTTICCVAILIVFVTFFAQRFSFTHSAQDTESSPYICGETESHVPVTIAGQVVTVSKQLVAGAGHLFEIIAFETQCGCTQLRVGDVVLSQESLPFVVENPATYLDFQIDTSKKRGYQQIGFELVLRNRRTGETFQIKSAASLHVSDPFSFVNEYSTLSQGESVTLCVKPNFPLKVDGYLLECFPPVGISVASEVVSREDPVHGKLVDAISIVTEMISDEPSASRMPDYAVVSIRTKVGTYDGFQIPIRILKPEHPITVSPQQVAVTREDLNKGYTGRVVVRTPRSNGSAEGGPVVVSLPRGVRLDFQASKVSNVFYGNLQITSEFKDSEDLIIKVGPHSVKFMIKAINLTSEAFRRP